MRLGIAVRRSFTVLLLATAIVACGGADGPSRGGVGADSLRWERDLGSALGRASSEGKIVMVDFYTDWCLWCKKLDQSTFADDEVRRALSAVVPVKLNAEKNGRREAEHFSIEDYPTILFLDATGKEISRVPGYMPAGPFLEELRDALRRV